METLTFRIAEKLANPETAFEIIVVYGIMLVTYGGLVLELMCLILFIYHFKQRTKSFCSPYFYLLTLGYVVNIVAMLISTLGRFTPGFLWFEHAYLVNQWYLALFLGPWNSFLAFSRFTSIVLWKRHNYIWTKCFLVIVVNFILLYPFIANAYILVADPMCFIQIYLPECYRVARELILWQFISNGVTVSLSAILSVTPAVLLHYKVIQFSHDTSKMEHHLLFQSLLSTLFFGLYCFFGIVIDLLTTNREAFNLSWVTEDSVVMFLFAAFSMCYYTYFHISSTVLLLVLS